MPTGTSTDETAKVEHKYRDFSQFAAIEEAAADQPQMNIGTGEEKLTSSFSDRNFPVNLHYMLNELEADGMSHIVSWQPHGRCFLVHKQQEFVERILPLWFRQTKFASFQRQLNIYGFNRLTVGPDKNAYYHEFFLRGIFSLSHRIQRMKVKGNGPRKASSAKNEPNFYTMRFLPGAPSVACKEQQQHANQWRTNPDVSPDYGPVLGPGGYRSESASLYAASLSPMALSSGMQTFSQSRGFPSYEGSLWYLALRLADSRRWDPPPPPHPATLAQALALRHQQCLPLAILPATPVSGVSLSERNNLARVMVLQSIIAGNRVTKAADNPTLAFAQRFLYPTQNGAGSGV